jgi:agmatine deiminase
MTTPAARNFRMPAEWAPHAGCWMIWPERPDNWRLGAKPAQAAFAAVATAISNFEPVTMMVSARQFANARALLPAAVRVVEVSTNDAWARDIGPSFLLGADGTLAGVDWPFNAWGGLEKGLYAPWDLDDQVAAKVLEIAGAKKFRAPKIIEGGAIHVDGEGTVMVTESCLLSEDRNEAPTRQDMARILNDFLGTRHVIWLGDGVPGDETGGHIDNLACFIRPGVVLLSWCDDPNDPHHAVSRDAEMRLQAARDAQGRAIEVIRIPMPTPMFITAAEAAGIDPGQNGMNRAAGERMAASYVNFYIANGAIIAPSFDVPTDAAAREILAKAFPERALIFVPGREILLGGGNIHCITQQQPKAAKQT